MRCNEIRRTVSGGFQPPCISLNSVFLPKSFSSKETIHPSVSHENEICSVHPLLILCIGMDQMEILHGINVQLLVQNHLAKP